MVIIPAAIRLIPMVLVAETMCGVAVAGATLLTAALYPYGAAALLLIAANIWASASSGYLIDFRILSFLPFAVLERRGKALIRHK